MKTLSECGKTCAQVADFLKVMAHPMRLRILARLAQGDRHVGGLAADLELGQSTVSQHLRILRMAGFVSHASSGGQRTYSLALPQLEQVLALTADIQRARAA